MATDDRTTAVERLESLGTLLAGQPDPGELAPLVEECEHLVSAVKAFHMEAIRFRMYNLHRHLQKERPRVPDEAVSLFEAARTALEAAGFQTK